MSVRVIDFACVSSIFLPQSETVMNVCLLTIWVYWQVGKTCIEGVSDHLEYFIEKTEPVCNSVFCSVSMICISFNNLHIAHRFYIVSFSKQEKCVVVLCVRFGCICVCVFFIVISGERWFHVWLIHVLVEIIDYQFFVIFFHLLKILLTYFTTIKDFITGNIFCIAFCRSLFVLLSFFSLPFNCLHFSNFRLLIITLVSLYFPFYDPHELFRF